MRIGHGYDVHQLVENRDLIIGGVKIDHTHGLKGHSDADVLVHAIIDSLLGAMAFGDIGKLFPDTDDTYKNVSSILLLEKVFDLMKNEKFKLINLDATIIAEKPKLRDYIDEMRGNVAKILESELKNVNIKATTEEKLGFTGNLEGISAHCVCLIGNK